MGHKLSPIYLHSYPPISLKPNHNLFIYLNWFLWDLANTPYSDASMLMYQVKKNLDLFRGSINLSGVWGFRVNSCYTLTKMVSFSSVRFLDGDMHRIQIRNIVSSYQELLFCYHLCSISVNQFYTYNLLFHYHQTQLYALLQLT